MLKKSLIKLFSFAATLTAFLPLQAQMDDNCCQNRFWLETDYLYWQVQDCPKIIPLVIEQPVRDGPFKVVLGGKKFKNDWHSGARFALGYWFDDCRSFGAEVDYFFLGKTSKHSNVAADENGSPRMRVPYFNVTTHLPASTALSTPGEFRGRASLKVSNRMQGAEFNIVKEIPLNNCSCFNALAGFRYWNFDDDLKFSTSSPLVVTPTIYRNQDKFHTQNNFYGAQIGSSFNQCLSCFLLNIKGKLALGAMCQKSTIHGRFQTNEFTGSLQTFAGGFFALPTNIGSHKKTRFAVIPELNVNIGCQITESLCLHVGYSILYASEVLRASKQMNRKINPTQSANIEFTPTPVLVGQASPKGQLRSSGLWVQGVNVGLDFSF